MLVRRPVDVGMGMQMVGAATSKLRNALWTSGAVAVAGLAYGLSHANDAPARALATRPSSMQARILALRAAADRHFHVGSSSVRAHNGSLERNGRIELSEDPDGLIRLDLAQIHGPFSLSQYMKKLPDHVRREDVRRALQEDPRFRVWGRGGGSRYYLPAVHGRFPYLDPTDPHSRALSRADLAQEQGGNLQLDTYAAAVGSRDTALADLRSDPAFQPAGRTNEDQWRTVKGAGLTANRGIWTKKQILRRLKELSNQKGGAFTLDEAMEALGYHVSAPYARQLLRAEGELFGAKRIGENWVWQRLDYEGPRTGPRWNDQERRRQVRFELAKDSNGFTTHEYAKKAGINWRAARVELGNDPSFVSKGGGPSARWHFEPQPKADPRSQLAVSKSSPRYVETGRGPQVPIQNKDFAVIKRLPREAGEHRVSQVGAALTGFDESGAFSWEQVAAAAGRDLSESYVQTMLRRSGDFVYSSTKRGWILSDRGRTKMRARRQAWHDTSDEGMARRGQASDRLLSRLGADVDVETFWRALRVWYGGANVTPGQARAHWEKARLRRKEALRGR